MDEEVEWVIRPDRYEITEVVVGKNSVMITSMNGSNYVYLNQPITEITSNLKAGDILIVSITSKRGDCSVGRN